ncbi:GNAT family N-acetyltransferase, partial [Bacillus paranthracis]|nr:GNAT family N-acetyltransferase [Bacillus paranthracis]
QKFECKIIYLSLHPDNKHAMGLYESFGFRLHGDIDDEGPVVGVVMELLIDDSTSL